MNKWSNYGKWRHPKQRNKYMNTLDKQYQDLLQDILDNGTPKSDRTGTGTTSVFGRQIRHNMKDGFPLLTTKKMPFKTIVTELLWFLRGDTNIKFLVDNNCHIWDGDAYKNYLKEQEKAYKIEYDKLSSNGLFEIDLDWQNFSQEEFINKIKTDDEFAKKWGELGKIYGFQWRNWGGWKDTKQTGFLHKTDNGWTVKWSDLHSFANGTEWLTTPIQDSDQSLYSDEDEGKKVYYKNITLGYDEKSFCPIQVAKVIDDKFDKYVGGIDQIANLINDLKTNPDSRRLMVNAWNVGELDQMVLPPCHYGFQVYTRELSRKERSEYYYKHGNSEGIVEGSLDRPIWEENNVAHKWYDDRNVPKRAISLMWNQRSVDTFLGLPFNIASYGLLLEIIAKEVNMVPDQLIGNLGDVHLYSNHIEQAKEQIGREYTLSERVRLSEEINGNLKHQTSIGMSYIDDTLKIPKRTREPFPLPTLKFSNWYKNANEEQHSSIVFNDWIKSLKPDDFILENYQSHPTIKAPLSN
jgi:thymidylate synthase